jgi:hypothetical protein
MEAKESNLVALITMAGNEAAAGFVTGLFFTLLHEQANAHLNSTLQQFLQSVDNRLQELLRGKGEKAPIRMTYALLRIIKGTGTVQAYTRGMNVWKLSPNQAPIPTASKTDNDIPTLFIQNQDLLILASNEPQTQYEANFWAQMQKLVDMPQPQAAEQLLNANANSLTGQAWRTAATPLFVGIRV